MSTLHVRLLSLATDAVRAANAEDSRAQGMYSELTSACSKIQSDIDGVKKENLNVAARKSS